MAKERFKGTPQSLSGKKRSDIATKVLELVSKVSLSSVVQMLVVLMAVLVGVLVWNGTQNSIQIFPHMDESTLREVFFGSKPWVLMCGSKSELRSTDPLNNLFVELHALLSPSKKTSFGVIDCSQVLPSGKTIAARFKLKTKWQPVILASLPWDKHRQIPPSSLKDVKSADRFLMPLLDPTPLRVNTAHDFEKLCGPNATSSTNGTCFVFIADSIMHPSTLKLQKGVVLKTPRVRFISVEPHNLVLSSTEQLVGLGLVAVRDLKYYELYSGPPQIEDMAKFAAGILSSDDRILSNRIQWRDERKGRREEQARSAPQRTERPQAEEMSKQEDPLTEEEARRQRAERERSKREEMDRQAEEMVTHTGEQEESDGHHDGDEDIIELD